jgi:hypothetical protein
MPSDTSMRSVLALGIVASFACGSSDAAAPTDIPKFSYACSDDSLYKVDIATNSMNLIGQLKGCFESAIISDIAVDSKGTIYVVNGSLNTADPATGTCTKVGTGQVNTTGLAFLPKGVLDPANEVLVGYDAATYELVDVATGKTQILGYLTKNPAVTLSSSGDVVYTRDKHLYVSVHGIDADGKNCGDCLVEADPLTGAIIKSFGDIKHPDVYGLASWGFDVFGFTNEGLYFQMHRTGDTLTLTDLKIANAPKTPIKFGGAATSTL